MRAATTITTTTDKKGWSMAADVGIEAHPASVPSQARPNTELWYTLFGVGHPELKRYQSFNRRLPSDPRCKLCLAPFRGPGSWLMRLQHREPSSKNPRFCSRCDVFLRKFPGGAEVETSIMFLDVRGSTGLAASMTPVAFSEAMHRFYAATFPLLNACDGFILDVRGDGLLVLFPPGFSGPDHAAKALRAARALTALRLTTPDGTPLPFSIGLHTGLAYVGTMTGAEAGVEDVTVLGDAANVAARLCSSAPPAQAWVSEATALAAGGASGLGAPMRVDIRGRKEGLMAYAISAAGGAPEATRAWQ